MATPDRSGKKINMHYIEDLQSLTMDDYKVIADYLNRQPGRYPLTAEDVRDEMNYFGIYRGLVKMDERVIGIVDCYVCKEENSAYGENLLIDPEYQGHVYGGSFMMSMFEQMRKVFHKHSDKDHYKIYSSFQGGNQRAGALYTRLGYFPLANTWIQNFIPYVYDYPFAQKFFVENNVDLVNCWKYYKPAYDEMLTAKKVQVYPYVFGVKDRFVRVMIDTITDRPLLVEDNQVMLACWIEEQQVFASLSKKVFWLCKNNSSEPLKLKLSATGYGKISFTLTEEISLAPGEVKEIVKVVRADGANDPETNYIETEVILPEKCGQRTGNDAEKETTVKLRTGYRIKEFYDIRFERDLVKPFRAGREYRRFFKVNNTHAYPLKAALNFTEGGNILLKGERQFALEIMPGQSGQVNLDFLTQASGLGVIKTALRLETIDQETGQPLVVTREFDLEINVLEMEGILAWKTESGRQILENENYLLAFQEQKRNGSYAIFDKVLKENVMFFPEEELGPTFVPEFVHETIPYFYVKGQTVSTENGRITVRTEFEQKYYQGIYLIRELKFGASNVFTLDYRLENRGNSNFTAGVLRKLWNGWRDGIGVMPLKDGLVRQQINELDYPGIALHTEFAENWMALENRGRVLGVVWGQGTVTYRKSYAMAQVDLGTCAVSPGESVQMPTLYLYYGAGTAGDVRNLFIRTGYGNVVQLQEREMFELNLTKQQLLINSRKASFALAVDRAIHFREVKWITGKFTAKGPANWQITVENLHGEQGESTNPAGVLHIELPESVEGVQPGLYPVEVAFESEVFSKRWNLYVWVTGSGNEIEIAEENGEAGRLLEVKNGLLEYRVSPEFGNRIVGLTLGGEEYLCTTFPKPGIYHRFNPWYGGIGYSTSLGRLLPQGTYQAQYDVAGTRLEGVGITNTVAGQPGLTLRMEYLTMAKSPVLAIHGIIENASETTVSGAVTVDTNWLNLQNVPEIEAYLSEGDTMYEYHLKAEVEKLDSRTGTNWLALETGKGNLLVAVNPDDNHYLQLRHWGKFGAHIYLTELLPLYAGEAREFTFYLILAKDLTEARQYRHLQPLTLGGK